MSAKPAFLDPRYQTIHQNFPTEQLDSSEQQWDDSEPTNVEELDRELAQQSSTELEKIAIRQNRVAALLRVCALLVPVGLSLGVLQLSWRQLYWRGQGDSTGNPKGINEDLAIFQIASKAHEVLIVLSLSDLILHYLRQQLVSSQGLPFGLLTSAYQVALGSQPVSIGFFYAVKSSLRLRPIKWQSIGLALLLLLTTAIGLAAGPASAIVLIPRLNWWSFQDLFTVYNSPNDYGFRRVAALFTMYIPKQLFPSVVDASSLPGSYCLDADLDVNASCPFAGYSDLLSIFNFTAQTENITIDSPPLSRIMATDNGGGDVSDSANTWTSNYVLANYLSLGWNLAMYGIEGNPFTVESKTSRDSVMTPVVQIFCDLESATTYNRSLAAFESVFENNLEADSTASLGSFDVRRIWNESLLVNANETMVEFEEMFQNTSTSGLVAFIYTPSNPGNDANVTMCTISASWDANKMWMISTGSQSVDSNFTWDKYTTREVDAENRPTIAGKVYSKPPPIEIRKGWADVLNAANSTSNMTVLAQLFQNGLAKANEEAPPFSNSSTQYLSSPSGYFALAHSRILSKVIADGLARIGSEYRVNPLLLDDRNILVCRNNWCSSGPFVDPPTGPQVLNGTVKQWRDYSDDLDTRPYDDTQLLQSFARPANADDIWTMVSFPVKRYGYGWSFDTVTVKVATAVLMLHVLVIIVHSCVFLSKGRSYAYASSLGELIALALNSKPPAALKSTSVAISRGASWARSTAVRELSMKETGRDCLELVINEGIEEDGELHRRRPTAGKRYQ